MLRPLLVVVALAAAAVGCAEPDPAPPPDAVVAADRDTVTAEIAQGTALREGDRAPDFALPDAAGRTVRLSELLVDGPVVLTFYRGAWCPYCNTQLRDYQEAIAQVEAADATLVAVSPQTPDGSLTTREKNALTFPVLSDAGGAVSERYGLLYQVDRQTRDRYELAGIRLDSVNGADAWELPVPATYVVDQTGTIRYAFVEADYTQRASARQVLAALRELAAAGGGPAA